MTSSSCVVIRVVGRATVSFGASIRQRTSTPLPPTAPTPIAVPFLPFARFEGRSQILLRLAPTSNNQQSGVNWARDFELERLNFLRPGAIAQLGERLRGTQEVGGSSPPGSITHEVPDAASRMVRIKSL